jgi:hypothetical protein
MRRVNVHTTDATADARVICRAFEARVTLRRVGKSTPGGAGTHTGHTRTDERTNLSTSQPSQPTNAPA